MKTKTNIIAALFATLALPVQAADLKVGFVYVSPIGEAGWTYQHELGRRAVEESFGAQVETTFVESVPEGADAERVINNLAGKGHDLIFFHFFWLYGAHPKSSQASQKQNL